MNKAELNRALLKLESANDIGWYYGVCSVLGASETWQLSFYNLVYPGLSTLGVDGQINFWLGFRTKRNILIRQIALLLFYEELKTNRVLYTYGSVRNGGES